MQENKKMCLNDHVPNEITKEAIKKSQLKRGAFKVDTVEELFKKLNS